MHDYDAVVIGSGFGGSVVACRLAEAGERVRVIERGRRHPPGSFPRTPRELSRSLWDPSEGLYGMFNVWSFPGLGAVVGSGLGGGSLIYANVLIRKEPHTFVDDAHESWPIGYDDLEPHYARVEEVLAPQTYPFTHEPYASRTTKAAALQAAGAAMPRRLGVPDAGWEALPLGVTFRNAGEPPRPGEARADDPPRLHPEHHPRLTCLLVGECDIGCNLGAKNTLDLTYLPRAAVTGNAEITTDCEVTGFAPLGGGGFRVDYVDHGRLAADGAPRPRTLPRTSVSCRRLVLAAGTLGSTFLLLRSADAFPGLSPAAGGPLSGNGDLLAFLVNARAGRASRRIEPSHGPVITGAVRVPASDTHRGHLVEDAGYPYLLSWLVEATRTPGQLLRAVREKVDRAIDRLVGEDVDPDIGAEIARILGDGALSSSSMPLLGMGRDIPDGRFRLDEAGRLTTDWSPEPSREYFDELRRTMRAIADELGGDLRDSRIPGVTQLVTVHPLGGCAMAADPARGVTDPWGEVHGYPGFFVVDGAVLPGPVGPNPALTIAAVADRAADRMLSGSR